MATTRTGTQMAKKGSSKALSVEHEEFIAKYYDGRRSESSGGADHDQGDVRDYRTLFECKAARPARKPTLVKQFEKVADEAWSEGREPAVALRYYWPDSPLADHRGFIDFSVRLVRDDLI